MKLNTLFIALLASAPSVFSISSIFTVNAVEAANMAVSTSTNSRNFTLAEDQPLIVTLTKNDYTLTLSDIAAECDNVPLQKIKFNKTLPLYCDKPTELDIKIRFSGDYAFTYNIQSHSLRINRQPKTLIKTEFKRPIPDVQCEIYSGGEVTINLDNSYKNGTHLRDAYSGHIFEVHNNKVTLIPSPESGGVVLLEAIATSNISKQQAPLNWKNANIYFVMIDRFNNADKTNDQSYGRRKDEHLEVGTFHGGDLKGMIEKLDYIKSLGTDAIWLSPIVEQIHGFVGGGDNGSFPFYGYHGYWTRDFTNIDQNFGDDQDLKELVTQAHQRGLKVILDVVINHSGYATLADLQLDDINVVSPELNWPSQWSDWMPNTKSNLKSISKPNSKQNWHSFHQQINYDSSQWKNWWGPDWIRADFPGHQAPGNSDINSSLAGLPDMLTESDKAVTPPNWLLNNAGTRVKKRNDFTVSDYLIEWQTDWVKRFGIDGFRVDTVKHVEPSVWKRLKTEGVNSLNQWRKDNDLAGLPFFMMGEVWGHTAYRSPYFDDGFDALINFDMQTKMDKGAACFSYMNSTYQDYANTLQEHEDFNPVSYMSSHDTELFFSRFNSLDMQRNAAIALLLSPGAIQVYYGDEVARKIGPYADDFHQGTRSDMLWHLDTERQSLLKHWQTIALFRQAHPAIGAGKHTVIKQYNGDKNGYLNSETSTKENSKVKNEVNSGLNKRSNAYVFSRTLKDDKVIVAFFGH